MTGVLDMHLRSIAHSGDEAAGGAAVFVKQFAKTLDLYARTWATVFDS